MIAPVAVAGILMLAVLAAMSSTNQAFAAKRTELTISATQTGPAKTVENNETKVPVTISGRLTSEGSGVAGATIEIQYYISMAVSPRTDLTTHTDSGGHYSAASEFRDHNSKYAIFAFTKFAPGEDYEHSYAETTFKLP